MHPPVLVQIKSGDTTSAIADRLGVSNLELLDANPDKRRSEMYFEEGELIVGEYLLVPERVHHQFLDIPLGGSLPERPSFDLAPTPSGCGPGFRQLAPGICVPDGTSVTPSKGNCPDGMVSYNGLCGPALPGQGGTPPSGGSGSPPAACGPGFRQLAPGICVPDGMPTGTGQGACPDGQIEAVPGVCIPNPLGGSPPGGTAQPGGATPPTPEECVAAYGANFGPYRDPASGVWGCAGCTLEHEILAANGFCYCGDGYVRQDPSDPNSPCVPSSSVPTDRPTKASSLKEAMDYCRIEYGPNSGAVLIDGDYVCNVCGANEEFHEDDGYCHCAAGTERAIKGDPKSACVPVKAPPAEEKKSVVGPVALGLAVAALIGVVAMSGGSDPDEERRSSEEARKREREGKAA